MPGLSRIPAIAFIITLISCTRSEPVPLNSTDYFPLQVGNYWAFSNASRRTVERAEVIDGKEYFRVVSDYDTSWYRKAGGKVFMKRANAQEALRFDLAARQGDKWQFESFEVRLINTNESIVLPAETLRNCYHYFFDYPGFIDDEFSVWLAPGIGIVREAAVFGAAPAMLTEAKIDGTVIFFE